MRLTGAARVLAALVVAASVGAAGPACRPRVVTLSLPDAATTVALPPVRLEEPTQVHFSFTGPTSVTFDWKGNGSQLRYWSRDAAPRTVEGHPPSPAPFSSRGPWQEAELTGLTPGAEYSYGIGDPQRPLTLAFRAPPAPGPARFAFAAVGDFGVSSDRSSVRVIHRLLVLAEPAFVLGLGDLTSGGADPQAAVERHFEDAMTWSQRAAYMPVWGEREWAEPGRDDLRNYKGRFALPHGQASPGAPPAGCCGEDWSWFDHAHVRFVAYPEPYAPAALDDWAARAARLLAEAEDDPKLRFVVTYGHRPAYSSGAAGGGGDRRLRAILDGLGARFPKYVLNLAAHDRLYERSRPQAHVVHITAGTGGSPLERAATPCYFADCKTPAWSAFRALRNAIVKVVVLENQLRVEAVCGPASPGVDTIRCADGEIFDSVKIGPAGQLVAR